MTNGCSVPTPTSMNLLLYITMAYEALTTISSASVIGMHAKVKRIIVADRAHSYTVKPVLRWPPWAHDFRPLQTIGCIGTKRSQTNGSTKQIICCMDLECSTMNEPIILDHYRQSAALWNQSQWLCQTNYMSYGVRMFSAYLRIHWPHAMNPTFRSIGCDL